MAHIDILTVFNEVAFQPNTPNWNNPDGSNSMKYANNNCLRMLSFSDRVSGNNGQWNLSVTVRNGDVIRWLDTISTQGDKHEDMIIYDFKISNTTEWNKYLNPLESDEFSAIRFYESSVFGTTPPSFQSITGPNNYLTTTVQNSPAQGERATLNYYLKVAKLKIDAQGKTSVVGTYGIDPTITIIG